LVVPRTCAGDFSPADGDIDTAADADGEAMSPTATAKKTTAVDFSRPRPAPTARMHAQID
jgi:hypothetical protein